MAGDRVKRMVWPVLVHSARTAMAAVASLLVARLFGLPATYWAPITTLVITQSSLGDRAQSFLAAFCRNRAWSFCWRTCCQSLRATRLCLRCLRVPVGVTLRRGALGSERISFRGRCADDCAFGAENGPGMASRLSSLRRGFDRSWCRVDICLGVAGEGSRIRRVEVSSSEFLAETERFAFSGNRRRIAILRSWQSFSSPPVSSSVAPARRLRSAASLR